MTTRQGQTVSQEQRETPVTAAQMAGESVEQKIQRLEQELQAEREAREKAEDNYRFMVERAADEKLDGYRELGAKAAAAEQRAEQAEAAIDAERSRREEAEKDAARYRAMRALGQYSPKIPHNFRLIFQASCYLYETLDEAIDAAIEGAK